MKRNLFYIVFALLIVLLAVKASPARANAGPHGGYTATTDACAGCHRAHTSGAANLLISSVPALCFTCHGASAAGADTNVTDGIYEGTAYGTQNAPLLGGGFTNYKGVGVSSTHSVTGAYLPAWGAGTIWGSTYDCAGCHNAESGLVWPGAPTWGISPGALLAFPGRGQNVTMPLTCTSCHDPHGGRNYRILQQRLHPWVTQQEDPPGYVLVTSNETGGFNPNQTGYVPNYTDANYQLGLGDWCTGCHATYHQADSGLPFNAEDGQGYVPRYRHPMNITLGALTSTLPLEDPSGNGASADDQLFCLSCHFAHGTNVAATGFAANVAPTNDSALLRLDNRGVCEECHKK